MPRNSSDEKYIDEESLGSQDTDDDSSSDESFVVLDQTGKIVLEETFNNIDELFATAFEAIRDLDDTVNSLKKQVSKQSKRIKAIEERLGLTQQPRQRQSRR